MAQASPADGLEIVGISKRYGDLQAVDDLSFSVPRGTLVGFLGPNGSGKTTTMRSIVGMVRLDHGSVSWDGRPIDDATRTRIGYMPQERGVYQRMKVREQVVYFGRLAGLSRAAAKSQAAHWLHRLGLSDRVDSLVQDLSGGNQQRVQLAVSLVHDPDLLVLDEPFAGLDPVAAEAMRDVISERADEGASVLFSSHQLNLVEGLSEEVVILSEGKLLAAGRIQDLRTASETRTLRARWIDPVQAGWKPLAGDIVEFDGQRVEVQLAAGSDIGAAMAHVLDAGPVSEIAVEPPRLSEIFAELMVSATVRS